MAVSPEERASNQIADTALTERETLKNHRETAIGVFDSHYDKLSLLLSEFMKSFAGKAFQANLISFTAMKNANFESIFSEFRAGLLWKSSVSEIQQQSKLFIDILKDIGGPLEDAAKDLAVKLSLADLQNLVLQYNLTYDDLEIECDDGLFNEVSLCTDRDYNKVGHCLNLSSDTLHSISQSHTNNVQRKIAVLWTWKRENGCSATAKQLIKAFLKMSDRYVAESILKYISRTKRGTGLESSEIHHDYLLPKSNFPIWDNLSLLEKMEKMDKLMEENCIVRKAYKCFVNQLMLSYKEKNFDPMVIQMHVLCYSQHDLVDFNFEKSDSISTVFCEISKHSCWFDYELFSEVIVCSDTEKEYLKTYEVETLIPYLKRSIFERPSSDKELHLALKVTSDLCEKGNKVKNIQRKLVKLLNLEEHVSLHFEKIS